MKYQTFAETTIEGGESHKKQNKPCQDRSKCLSENGLYIAVVADGHGSDNCFRSEYGAEFAVSAAVKGIYAFIANLRGKELPLEENFARQIKRLADTIVDNWIYQVSEHYRRYPITEEDKDYPAPEGKTRCLKGLKNFQVDSTYRELYLKEAGGEISGKGGLLAEDERPVTRHAYGATLIAAAITEDYWFGLQIGDGKLTAFYPDAGYDQPVPWDDKCYLNVTTSICDDDAAERARVYVKKRGGSAATVDAMGAIKKLEDNRPMPAAIFLNSDGVDDSFPIEENMNHMAKKFYYPVLRMFIEYESDPAKGWKTAIKELADYLPDLSKRGSGDDVSVAGIVDMDAVKAESFQDVLQKAKVEAEERRVKEQAEREKAIKAAEAARAEEAARKAAKEEADTKTIAVKKAAEETKTIEAVKPTEQAGTHPASRKTVRQSTAPQRTKPPVRRQPADDPAVQAAAIAYKAQQEAAKVAALLYEEFQQKADEAGTRLKERILLHRRTAEEETDTDIPASDVKEVPPKPQPGTNIDTNA